MSKVNGKFSCKGCKYDISEMGIVCVHPDDDKGSFACVQEDGARLHYTSEQGGVMKRYEPDIDYERCGDDHVGYACMVESTTGDWVKYEDVQKLREFVEDVAKYASHNTKAAWVTRARNILINLGGGK